MPPICTLLQETFGRLGTLDAPIPRLPLLPDKYVVSGLSTDLAKLAAPSGTSLLASWLEAALRTPGRNGIAEVSCEMFRSEKLN